MLRFIYRGHDRRGFFADACLLDPGQSVLAPLADNMPPAEGAYLCIVPVLDAWRVIPSLARQRGARYFGDAIEPAVLADVRAGRALIVFDICNEGPVFHADVFHALHRFAAERQIPMPRLIWLSQNRAVESAYHATYQAPDVYCLRFEVYDFFIKHAVWRCARPDEDGAIEAHVAAMFDPQGKDRVLLCPNAAPRVHRVVTVAALMQLGVFEESLVLFAGLQDDKDGDVGDHEGVARFLAAHPGLAYLRESCMAAMELRGLKVDGFSEAGNALFDKIDVQPYRRTFFSLVTETEVSDGAVDRVTEKLIKAFCLGHPNMVVGNPASLRFARELGFQDFAPVIPALYDRESDPGRRLQMVFEQVGATCAAIRRDPAAWLGAVREIVTHNAGQAMRGRALEAYVARYERPLRDRLARLLADG